MNADPDLDALLGDVTRAVDEDIVADPGCPDLAAVIARAHELDPQRVPAAAVEEVGQWAPVVSIQQGHRRRRTRDDLELLAVIEGVRSHVEEDVAQRLGTPPPVNAESPQEPSRRVWGYVLAVAAALVLVAGGLLNSGVLSQASEPVPNVAPFQSGAAEPQPIHQSQARQPEPAPAVDEAPVVEELAIEDEPVVEEPEPLAEADITPVEPRPSRSGKRVKLSLEELDAAADAAWREGDLPRAERLYRALVKRAGKNRLGDLAYGDLFTLARQTKSPGKEVSLWREYLRRFPKGRFADDARSGLCRRAKGNEQVECWTRYLADMPEGSHRARAQRAIDAAGDTP